MAYQYSAVYLCPIFHHADCGTVYFARVEGHYRWVVFFFQVVYSLKREAVIFVSFVEGFMISLG